MIFGLQVRGIQVQLAAKFLRRLVKLSALEKNQSQIVMNHRNLIIERERCLQFFQSLRSLALFVIGLAQNNVKLGAITPFDEHLLDYLIGILFLSLFDKGERQSVVDSDIERPGDYYL